MISVSICGHAPTEKCGGGIFLTAHKKQYIVLSRSTQLFMLQVMETWLYT